MGRKTNSYQKPRADKGRLNPTREASSAPSTQHISISLRHLKNSHCISKCQKNDKVAFTNSLKVITNLTWAEASVAGKHQSGYEVISTLNRRLPDIAKGKNAIAFRFSDRKPMVGFREGDVFYVVWFDRDYTLYKH